ncbi:MAG: hypothetical protein ABIX01_05045 [Chitinophagaceae bacterium]
MLLHFTSLLFAQIDLINRSAARNDSAFLFMDIENQIKITGVKGTRNIKIKYGKWELSLPGKDSIFPVSVTSAGRASITIAVLQKGRLFFQKEFTIIPLPRLQLVIGSFFKGPMTTGQIVASRVLMVARPGYIGSLEHVVGSFSLRFETRNIEEVYRQYNITGRIMPVEMVPLIKKLVPGDTIVFENIRTIDADSYYRTLDDLSIVIK